MIDLEYIVLRIRDFLQTNLNTAITNLNTAKNDGLTLDTVSNDAYFIQTLNQAIVNYNPYIIVGVTDIRGDRSTYSGTVKQLVFQIVIVVADTMDLDLQIGIRMLRYLRILEELFNLGFNKVMPSAKFTVNSLVPISLTAMDSNDRYRAVGVEIVTSLG